MEPSAAPLDTTPDPAIVQPPGASPPVPPREQQQEQLRIGESGQFSEGLEDRGEHPPVPHPAPAFLHAAPLSGEPPRPETPNTHPRQLFLHPPCSTLAPRSPGPAPSSSFRHSSPSAPSSSALAAPHRLLPS